MKPNSLTPPAAKPKVYRWYRWRISNVGIDALEKWSYVWSNSEANVKAIGEGQAGSWGLGYVTEADVEVQARKPSRKWLVEEYGRAAKAANEAALWRFFIGELIDGRPHPGLSFSHVCGD